jgi:ABC-type transporter Mla subunit MlaD
MFNPEFDPMAQLQGQEVEIRQHTHNIKQLADAFNNRTQLIDRLIESHRESIQKISQLEHRINQLEQANEKNP